MRSEQLDGHGCQDDCTGNSATGSWLGFAFHKTTPVSKKAERRHDRTTWGHEPQRQKTYESVYESMQQRYAVCTVPLPLIT